MIEFAAANPALAAVVAALWIALALYGASAAWWLVEATVLARGGGVDPEEVEWGYDDVQVRILTIDAEPVVQATVNAVPDGIDDVRVIAEADIEVDGADVHVVPDTFECDATNKGRAVEWARRHVPCDREYVLYLDEDTIMAGFEGLPDADVIQFTEKPLYTGSRIAYLSEVFRVGYQYEQFAFHRLRYPLYAWGGGVAVRSSLEREITWDVATITEDTNFIWRAADEVGVSFAVLDVRFRNQAPPSLRAMTKQRRRWISGTRADGHLLPLAYRPLYYTRIIAWAFSPLVPLLVLASLVFPGTAPGMEWYRTASLALFCILFVYTLVGAAAYDKHPLTWPLYLLLTPVAFLAHSAGALWGVVSPVTTFEVTEKVTPDVIESVHESMEDGALSEHDGAERLMREADEEFTFDVFDD
ncbi:glycosyltransferase family 2 protein [Halorubrum sp. SD626R]|uniref:glycosyltransferase family 2 protein n=1 Tax=Halorubrum sp. SD626R TaxID=1419722 RepID=UPI0010F44EFB|nr:glycosyltransferase family 2 protein [Halorubrum sp. SD626R]TKX77684.1 glycosyltransferase family 2 protein [Halorubrum sp. SD626R]